MGTPLPNRTLPCLAGNSLRSMSDKLSSSLTTPALARMVSPTRPGELFPTWPVRFSFTRLSRWRKKASNPLCRTTSIVNLSFLCCLPKKPAGATEE
eukprot:8956417-Heterocapsa_arctica.AAC.1